MNNLNFPEDWPATIFPDAIDRDETRRLIFGDLPLGTIRECVCSMRGVTEAEFLGSRRNRRISWARQEACWLAHKLTGRSYPQVARAYGYADHTTVIYGVKAVEDRRLYSADYALDVDALKAML